MVTFDDDAFRLKESVVKRNDDEWMVVQLGSLSETEIIAKEFLLPQNMLEKLL